MNSRAFNLFTALVSFVLIILAVLLANAMTQTEDKAIATVSDLEQQSQLQTIADLARADALQVFTYNLRLRMEGWLTDERYHNYFPLYPIDGCNSTTIDTAQRETCWQQLVDKYVSVNFGSGCGSGAPGQSCVQKFANDLTDNMLGTLSQGSSFGRYNLSLKIDKTSMINALTSSIENSVDPVLGKKFFEAINCTDEYNCDTGTFYVNVDLSKGAFDPGCRPELYPDSPACQNDERIYESLPKIRVQNVTTKNFLHVAILPRRKLRIYIPLRIFKAVAHAKKIADQTVFDPAIRQDLQAAGLGICDPGSCNPRTDPFGSVNGKWEGHLCPNSPRDVSFPLSEEDTTVLGNSSLSTGPVSYKPWKENETANALKTHVIAYLSQKLTQDNRALTNPLDPNPTTCPALDATNIHCVGADFTDVRIYAIESRLNTFINRPSDSSDNKAYCAAVQQMTIMLSYNEQNKLYRVNRDNERPYYVRIDDTKFSVGFFERPNPIPLCKPACTETTPGTCGGGYHCDP